MKGGPEAGLGHVQSKGPESLRQAPRRICGLKTKMAKRPSLCGGAEGCRSWERMKSPQNTADSKTGD